MANSENFLKGQLEVTSSKLQRHSEALKHFRHIQSHSVIDGQLAETFSTLVGSVLLQTWIAEGEHQLVTQEIKKLQLAKEALDEDDKNKGNKG
jgi:hypothetical protein